MSALSKVFVGVLIVLSLLLSSAVIVWVNKTEDFKKGKDASDMALVKETKAHTEAANAAEVVQGRLMESVKTYSIQVDALQTELKARDLEVSKREVEVANLSSKVNQQLIAMTAATEALKASESAKKLQGDQIAEIRGTNDKLLKEKSDLNLALSDATNRLEVVTREWKFLKEQLAEAQNQGDKLTKQVKDLGGNPNVAVAGVKAGAPALNGIIREVRTLEDNRPWATISLGTADAVVKGMEFKVIDRGSGTFLGILTIQSVQANQAVGTLAGPKIAEIKVGNEVRTQL